MTASDPFAKPYPVVLQAGAVQFARGERFGFPRVESRMVLGCRAGHGQAWVDGVCHEIAPGTLLALPWAHRIAYAASSTDPFLLLGAHLVPRHDPAYAVELTVAHEPRHPHAGSPGRADDPRLAAGRIVATAATEHPALAHLLATIVEVFERRSPQPATVRALGLLLRDELAALPDEGDGMPGDGTRGVPDDLRRVLTYAERHLAEPVTVAALADVCGVSPTTLTRWFRTHLGHPPMHWLLERRIAHAMALLRTTALTVSQVAARCGFGDPYYFSRVFRGHVGQPPTEWRRRQRLL